MESSYRTSVGNLEARIKELEEENANLKRRLSECLKGKISSQDER